MTVFSAPASGTSWRPADAVGHLLVIEVGGLEKDISTSYGPSDAIRATVHDITGAETYDDTLIFSGTIIGALKPRVGQKVLVRLEYGKAKPGQSPPYVLVAMNESEQAERQAVAYLQGRERKGLDELAGMSKDEIPY